LRTRPVWPWVSPSLLCSGYRVSFAGRGVNCLPQFSVRLKKGLSYTWHFPGRNLLLKNYCYYYYYLLTARLFGPRNWQQAPLKSRWVFTNWHIVIYRKVYSTQNKFRACDKSSDAVDPVHSALLLPELSHVRLHMLRIGLLRGCTEPCGMGWALANPRYSDHFERYSGCCRHVANRPSVNRVDDTVPR
jgi:hypothetical protein